MFVIISHNMRFLSLLGAYLIIYFSIHGVFVLVNALCCMYRRLNKH